MNLSSDYKQLLRELLAKYEAKHGVKLSPWQEALIVAMLLREDQKHSARDFDVVVLEA